MMKIWTRRSVMTSLPLAGAFVATPLTAQNARLYNCEGCEGIYDRQADSLTSHFQVAAGSEPGEPLILKGRVLSHREATPVPDVIIYIYHTNNNGLYTNGVTESGWSQRHGHLRGWAKTDAEGRYEFHTIKPAPYPDAKIPAHIHPTLLEPGRRPYWIDNVVFEGEFSVNYSYRRRQRNQGGNGIVKLARSPEGAWLAKRDIRLEQHP